jgi:bifunctional non-homologous end joining protein LigD
MTVRRFGSIEVELSNTDKVLFPDANLTKGDLIDYYDEIAEIMLPHARGRPLTLQRFPDGIQSEGFFQQRRSEHFPDWIDSARLPRAAGKDEGEPVEHVTAEKRATLVYLANQGVITLHGWLSRLPEPKHPDRLIFDLDPPGEDFAPVRSAAAQVAELMEAIGLSPHVMTTGSRGLHVVAPIRAEHRFDHVRELAVDMARTLADAHPDSLTTEQRKDKRRGRLYLDVMRNAYGQTAVLPYTVRARTGAPVATPLDWDEVTDRNLDARSYTLENVFRRLGQKPDPWADIARHAAGVDRAREALKELAED